jgi:hypothetical protein
VSFPQIADKGRSPIPPSRERLHWASRMRDGAFGVSAVQAKMNRLDPINNRRVGQRRPRSSAKIRNNAEARRLVAQTYGDA